MDTLRKIEELIEQNKNLEHRNEELKNIIEVNLAQPGYDVYLTSFNDIIDVSEAETLIVKFYQHSKIPTALYDHKGKLIFSIGWKQICRHFHRVHHESLLLCQDTLDIVNKSLAKQPYYFFQCKNGINGIAISIEIYNKHVATIILSQFFYKDETPDYVFFKQQAANYKFNVKPYISAVNDIPTYSNTEIESIFQNASFLAEMISFLGSKNIEYNNRSKKQIDNKMLLSSLRDKINEEELIIKSLLQNITKHQKEVQENTVSKTHFLKQLKRLNDRIEHSENILNSLLSSIPLGIGFIRSNVFTYVNDQICRITGYTSKEFIGRNPEFLFPYSEDIRKIFPKNNSLHKTDSIETRLQRKDGTLVNVIVFVALLNNFNSVQGIAFSLMDITAIQENHSARIVTKEHAEK